MSLLSPAQIAQIRGAIKSVTDTFMVTPVILYQITVVDDLYNEDRDTAKAVAFNVGALAEYSDVTDEQVENQEGSVDYNQVKLTLNLDDMVTAGVVVGGAGVYTCVLETERDYFRLKGILYRINDIVFDGPLESKEVLLIIQGGKSQTRMVLDIT